MQKESFTIIRKKLKKTQKEIAALLGISKKTVESYEQGFRNIPGNIERILYFLLFKLNMDLNGKIEPCWQDKKCTAQSRENCVAWIAGEGFFCWFITGKVCTGEKEAVKNNSVSCFHCSFFRKNLGKILPA